MTQSSGHALSLAILFTLSVFRPRGQFSLGVPSSRKVDSDESEMCSDVYVATAAASSQQPAASLCYSLWAYRLLILSVSFSLKRYRSGCDGFQLPVLMEPAA